MKKPKEGAQEEVAGSLRWVLGSVFPTTEGAVCQKILMDFPRMVSGVLLD